MEAPMHIVYLLRSQKNPNRVYVGLCGNMKKRLREHNAGECKSTAEARPWAVDVAVFFRDEKKAHAFERYLKTGSGRAFSKRHL
jgi:putative endonuclease